LKVETVTEPLHFEAAPLGLHRVVVRPEWLNASGHMRAAQYIVLFDEAIEGFLVRTGLSSAPEAGAAPFLMEMHTCYQRELRAGEEVDISLQVLGVGEKRLHLIMFMQKEGNDIVATTELVIVNVALESRRAQCWTPQQRDTLAALVGAHAKLPAPPQAGRAILPGRR
jgi:acyl-CoA thioesterase FadM